MVGDRVSSDRDGRLYTTTSRGQIHVWADDGTPPRVIGTTGAGPGEFAPGRLGIFPSPTGHLYVRDNQHRFTVLDSAFKVQYSLVSRGSSSIFRAAVLSDGTFLDAERPPDPTKFFGVVRPDRANVDHEPTLVRSFGDVPASERRVPRTSRGRLLAYAGGTRFWAGPPQATGRGYELQEWSVAGELIRTVRRSASWYPAGSDRVALSSATSAAPPSEIVSLFALGEELVLVVARVTNARAWDAYQRAPGDTAKRNLAFDLYWDVLDMRSGQLLASEGPHAIGAAQHLLPHGWFQGTMRGYRPVQLPDDEDGLRAMELQLVRR